MYAYSYLSNSRVIIHFQLPSISLIFLLWMLKYVPEVEALSRVSFFIYLFIYFINVSQMWTAVKFITQACGSELHPFFFLVCK